MAYTTIDDPSAYFQTALYTGTGSGQQVINDGNSDLQPDWIWVKRRDSLGYHQIIDSSRGGTKRLWTNDTGAEGTQNNVASFDSDGFTAGNESDITPASTSQVAWQWKANGGTTATNDASSTGIGNTDSVYQVNSTAKFSIVTWTGSGSGTVSIAHGLGSTPKFFIIKQRDGANSWLVYHHRNTVVDEAHDTFLKLHLTNASSADANNYFMDNTAPTSTVATFGSGTEANASGTYIGYFFDEVQGYSKFGSYTGNGNADGTFIYTGFAPAWVMIKRTDTAKNWYIFDNKRPGYNVINRLIAPNLNSAEVDGSEKIDLLSNGFKLRQDFSHTNTDGGTFIYVAFASSPFVSSEGVPTTAR